MWLRRVKYFLLKFLRLKDSPRSAALGFALGAISNFLPAIGIGGLLAAFLAGIFRVNILASIIGHYVFAPIFPFLLYLNVRIGHLILGGQMGDFGQTLHNLVNLDFQSLGPITKAFSLGAGINIGLAGIVLFLISFRMFKHYRKDIIIWLATKRPIKKLKFKPKRNKKIK